MRRQKLNIDPDLGDLEEMLAHVQTQIEYEIDLEKDREKMPSLTSVQESPKMLKKNSSFGKADTFSFRNRNGRPPLVRASEIDSGSRSFNGYDYINGSDGQSEYQQPIINGRGSQTSLKSDEVGSQCSLQSFRSEPGQRLSLASLPEKKGSSASLNGRSRTATLPRGYGSSKERNWENYWAQ